MKSFIIEQICYIMSKIIIGWKDDMLKKKMALFVLLVLLLLVGCKKQAPKELDFQENIQEEIEVEVPEDEEISLEGKAINPLTGLYIDEDASKRRPIGIMINNLKAAMPQSGIAQADIVYETLVEGAICRLFAIFQDFDEEKIGPIRSARHYFLDFAFDYDGLYVHYGQSPQAYTAIRSLASPALNGLSYLDSIMCFQDPNRVRPHSTYTSFERLIEAWETVDYRKEVKEGFSNPMKFHEEEYTPMEGDVAQKVRLSFSYYQEPYFLYNEEEGLYERYQFDKPQIDDQTKEQLKYKNIIIQLVDMWNIPGDTEGRLDMSLIGTGRGYYVTKGKVIPIIWEKKSHTDATIFLNPDGSEIRFNKGKTWVAVFPSYREDHIVFLENLKDE